MERRSTKAKLREEGRQQRTKRRQPPLSPFLSPPVVVSRSRTAWVLGRACPFGDRSAWSILCAPEAVGERGGRWAGLGPPPSLAEGDPADSEEGERLLGPAPAEPLGLETFRGSSVRPRPTNPDGTPRSESLGAGWWREP